MVFLIFSLMLLGIRVVYLEKQGRKVCRNCNVILIVLDSLPASRISHLGHQLPTTPRLDALATQGVSFANAYTTSLDFPASILSIMSGRYPSDKALSGVQNGEIPTLASILKSHRYKSAGFIAGLNLQTASSLKSHFDLFIDTGPTGTLESGLSQALDWVGERKDDQFFLLVSGNDLADDAPIREGYTGQFFPPQDFPMQLRATGEAYRTLRQDLQQEKPVISEYRTFWSLYYDSKLHDVDRAVGAFLESFGKLGLSEKTIVVVVSDYGTELMEHGQVGNSNALFEERIRIPLILSVPGLQGGRIFNQQVSSADIAPTIIELLSIQQPNTGKTHGVSLVPSLYGRTLSDRDVFMESRPTGKPYQFGLRTADGWKFIYTAGTGERELYNLQSDPKELQNLNPDGSPQELMKRVFDYEWRIRKHLDSIGADPYDL